MAVWGSSAGYRISSRRPRRRSRSSAGAKLAQTSSSSSGGWTTKTTLAPVRRTGHRRGAKVARAAGGVQGCAMLIALLVILGLAVLAYGSALVRAALAKRAVPSAEALVLGAVVNFLDTLGIGSFA